MLKYLTIATLICLPSFALASNVPFVGKREFVPSYQVATGDISPAFYGNGGYMHRIEINKNGRVKITYSGCVGAGGCKTSIKYQGKYRSVMPIGQGEYVSILSKDQIAYTDKYGNILNACLHIIETDSENIVVEGQPCITNLQRISKSF